ncbi:MAG: Gfo/Idh/MocA family oxidoreductase [Verrucomicrobiales bacterium]|nr:Gfo/Idh/MocA family oxidoreductase [Verrucomicrobiales bacterium]
MTPVNIAIVGLGFMASTHIKAYRKIPGARIAALCNPSGRNLDGDFSKVFGNVGDKERLQVDMTNVRTCRNFSELLSDPEIDLIDLCTPTVAHHPAAIEALKAGKHVLCEKPLARTAKLAREIADVAKQSKGFFMPAMCVRFWPDYVWVHDSIAGQTYGKVLAARFRRVAEPPAWGQKFFLKGELSGGALLDLHIHDTDFVQHCFGRPRSVYSTGYTKFSGAIDHVVTQYHFESGVLVHAEGSWAMSEGFGFSAGFTVNFEFATADFDLARGADALRLFEKGHPARTVKPDGPDGYVRELSHMLESIRAGEPPTVVTAEDAVSAVEICEAEERSIREGRPVQLLQTAGSDRPSQTARYL